MMTLRLKELLNEFEEWVVEGRVTKIPYQEWRFLKQHAEDQVRIERDGWGDLGIFSETCCKFLVEGWAYDDGSFGTYLDTVYTDTYDSKLYAASNGCYGVWQGEPITPTVEIRENDILFKGKSINETITETIDAATGAVIRTRKENDNMNNLFKGFDFGSCENDNVKMSMYGIAVKNASNTWVSYDVKSNSVVDVDILNFSAKYLYKMPVALKDVKPGDVIIHNRKPMFVEGVEDGKLITIDPAAGEEKIVLPTKNIFGFDFATKVVNLFGDIAAGASTDSPFGNMLPLMLLGDSTKSDDMLPLLFMMNGGGFDMSNPMTLYFLMKDNKNTDLLPFMLMANGTGFAFGKNECKCNCDHKNS